MIFIQTSNISIFVHISLKTFKITQIEDLQYRNHLNSSKYDMNYSTYTVSEIKRNSSVILTQNQFDL